MKQISFATPSCGRLMLFTYVAVVISSAVPLPLPIHLCTLDRVHIYISNPITSYIQDQLHDYLRIQRPFSDLIKPASKTFITQSYRPFLEYFNNGRLTRSDGLEA